MINGACIAVIGLGPTLVAQRSLGTAAVGAMAIANNVSVYANKVDEIVTSTVYPVIAAVKDRIDLLEEAFLKSNRVGLLWAAPTGLAIAFFAHDLVHLVLGSRWEIAIPLLQSFGLVAVVNQIAFNWTAFFRAIGDTRPIAVGGVALAVAVSVIAVPLLAIEGLEAFGVGWIVASAAVVVVRLVYLRRLFSLGADPGQRGRRADAGGGGAGRHGGATAGAVGRGPLGARRRSSRSWCSPASPSR